ncbi:eCIS core domain-containing protein [Undibacterium sp. TJN19]|uniref:eCIS core domain-containing protein n=1 Tax=Undibacterium sp. TJN19 TaxID=3413055 RepID=UPI003BF1951B
MAYKSEPRQKAAQHRDEASAKTSAQRKADTSFVDKRASATSQLQLKAMMDASPRHASLRNLKQLMTNHAGLDTAPVQKQANEELLQARFATAQLAKDDELLQGKFEPAQRAKDEELMQGKFATTQLAKEEELLQGKFEQVQRVKEEDLLQGKFETAQLAKDEELLQGKFEPAQRVVEEDPLQGKFETAQLAKDEELLQGKFASAGATTQLQQASTIANDTGLPKQLKAGVEALSGMSLDHVKVHYNSAQPAQMQAHAYAQGSDIHLAPGQEKHLPHEAWHVVQQAQGRVKPTLQMKGTAVNDDVGLETEADVMGAKAQAVGVGVLQGVAKQSTASWVSASSVQLYANPAAILQRTVENIGGKWVSSLIPDKLFTKKKAADDAEVAYVESRPGEDKSVKAEVKAAPVVARGGLRPNQIPLGVSNVGGHLTTLHPRYGAYVRIVCLVLNNDNESKEVHVHYRRNGTVRVTKAEGGGGTDRVVADASLAAEAKLAADGRQ